MWWSLPPPEARRARNNGGSSSHHYRRHDHDDEDGRNNDEEPTQQPQQQPPNDPDQVTLYVPDTPEWSHVACLLPVRRSWAQERGVEGVVEGGKRGGRAVERRVLATLASSASGWRAVTVSLPPLEARWRRSRHGDQDDEDLPPLWVWPAGEEGDDSGEGAGLFGAVPVAGGGGAHALLPALSASSSSSPSSLPSSRWRAARLVQRPLVVVADLDALVGGPVVAAEAEGGASAGSSSSSSSRRRRPAAGRNERALARLRDALSLASVSSSAQDAGGAETAALASPPPTPAPAALVVATPRRWPAWQRLWAERQGHLPAPDAVVAASCTEVYVRLNEDGGGAGDGDPAHPRWGLDKHWRALLRDEARRSGWSRGRAERVARALMGRYGGGGEAVVVAAPSSSSNNDDSTWLPALPPTTAPTPLEDNGTPNHHHNHSKNARMGPPDRQSPVRVQLLVRKRLLAPFLRDLGAALDQLAAEAATAAAAAQAAAEAQAAVAASSVDYQRQQQQQQRTPIITLPGPWAAVHVHAERGWAVVDLVPGGATLPRALRHLRAAGKLGAAWPSGRLQRERERRLLARELRRSLLLLEDDQEDQEEQEEERQQQHRRHHQNHRPRVVSVRLPPEGPRGAGSALPARWAGSAGLGARSAEEEAAAPLVPGADVAVVVGNGGVEASAASFSSSPPPPPPAPPFAAGLLRALEEEGLI